MTIKCIVLILLVPPKFYWWFHQPLAFVFQITVKQENAFEYFLFSINHNFSMFNYGNIGLYVYQFLSVGLYSMFYDLFVMWAVASVQWYDTSIKSATIDCLFNSLSSWRAKYNHRSALLFLWGESIGGQRASNAQCGSMSKRHHFICKLSTLISTIC